MQGEQFEKKEEKNKNKSKQTRNSNLFKYPWVHQF